MEAHLAFAFPLPKIAANFSREIRWRLKLLIEQRENVYLVF